MLRISMHQACAEAHAVHAARAQELKAEAPDAPLLLTKANLERALMARLMEPPETYPQWPVPYLCAARAAMVSCAKK